MKKINIAIEGPVASGKGTVAWELAKRLDYKYIDTGALYRALTLACITANVDPTDEEKATEFLKTVDIQYKKSDDVSKYRCKIEVNGEDVTPFIRTQHVSSLTPYIAGYNGVRPKVIAIEKETAKDRGAVIEGRAVIEEAMPDAELKIYLTAADTVRAHRRWLDLQKSGETITEEEVLHTIQTRDTYDATRANGKLSIHPKALVVDTSEMTIEEAINTLHQKAIEIITS
jgi:cytidylate kinase